MVSDEQLLEDLREFADEIGETPSSTEMRKNGPWDHTTYIIHFGSWNNALKQAGLKLNRVYDVSDEQLLEDLREFAEEIGKTPSKTDIEKDGPWSYSTYQNHLGSWNDALKQAGLAINKENTYKVSDEQLLQDLKEFADEIRKTPSQTDIEQIGPWSYSTYQKHFGSWNNALKQAGLRPNQEYNTEVKWDDSVTDYYGKSYKEMREKVIKRDGEKCRACSSEEKLHVHHIKPRRLFENINDSNTLDNLITLCPSCHKIFENEWTECDPDEFDERAKASLNK